MLSPAVSQIPVVESEDHTVDANLSLSSSEDITPILYVGESSRGLTNLLLTHPTTSVRTLFKIISSSLLRRHHLFFAASRSMDMIP